MEMIGLPVPQLVTPSVSDGLALLTKAKGSLHDHLLSQKAQGLLSSLDMRGCHTQQAELNLEVLHDGKVVCSLDRLLGRDPSCSRSSDVAS